jgi:hypothetical protein
MLRIINSKAGRALPSKVAQPYDGTEEARSYCRAGTLTRGILSKLAVAAVLAVALSAVSATHAQSRGYWASDGCYYRSNGYQWQRVECRYYDTAQRTWVARNSNGTFYYKNGSWLTPQQYAYVTAQELARAYGAASVNQNQAIIEEFMRSNGVNGSVNLGKAIGNTVSRPYTYPYRRIP